MANLNHPGTVADGDFNGDGFVDFADFQLLESNLGKTSPGLSPTPAANAIYLSDPASTVPEPTALALLTTAATATLLRRHRAAGR
jgi:hypothetical protein